VLKLLQVKLIGLSLKAVGTNLAYLKGVFISISIAISV